MTVTLSITVKYLRDFESLSGTPQNKIAITALSFFLYKIFYSCFLSSKNDGEHMDILFRCFFFLKMWLLNCTFSLMRIFFSTTWDALFFKTQWNRACTSGPVVVCLGLSSVSRGSSPCRQAEETFCTPCTLRLQPSSLFACDPCITVTLSDCTDLLLQYSQTPKLNGFNLWCYLERRFIWGAEYTWVPCCTAWQMYGSPLRQRIIALWLKLHC